MLQFTSGQTLPGAFPNTAVKRLRVRLVAMAPHVDEGPQPAGAIPRVRRGGERRRRRNAPDPAPTPRGIPGRRPYRICLGLLSSRLPPRLRVELAARTPANGTGRSRPAVRRRRARMVRRRPLQDAARPTVSRRRRLGGAGEISCSLLPVEIISAHVRTHTRQGLSGGHPLQEPARPLLPAPRARRGWLAPAFRSASPAGRGGVSESQRQGASEPPAHLVAISPLSRAGSPGTGGLAGGRCSATSRAEPEVTVMMSARGLLRQPCELMPGDPAGGDHTRPSTHRPPAHPRQALSRSSFSVTVVLRVTQAGRRLCSAPALAATIASDGGCSFCRCQHEC